MAEVKRIFITGAPGSMWSKVDRYIRRALWQHIDNSDVTPYRNHEGHRGAYWNPGNEPGYDWILNFDKYDRDHIIETLDTGFLRPIEEDERDVVVRTYKSHHFAYHLDQIKEQFPDAAILMWQQPDHFCYVWWYACGGHDTVFDPYHYYKRSYKDIWNEIVDQNKAIQQFVDKHGLSRDIWTSEWIADHFGKLNPTIYDIATNDLNEPIDEDNGNLMNYRDKKWITTHEGGTGLYEEQRISIIPWSDGFKFT